MIKNKHFGCVEPQCNDDRCVAIKRNDANSRTAYILKIHHEEAVHMEVWHEDGHFRCSKPAAEGILNARLSTASECCILLITYQ